MRQIEALSDALDVHVAHIGSSLVLRPPVLSTAEALAALRHLGRPELGFVRQPERAHPRAEVPAKHGIRGSIIPTLLSTVAQGRRTSRAVHR